MQTEPTPAVIRETNINPFMTTSEVARIFRVHPRSVIRWANAGKIASTITPGGHRRFRRSDVLDAQLTDKNAEGTE